MGLKIKAELGGDGTGFERMMTRAGATANRFASGSIAPLKNLIAGAFSVGAISALTKGTIEYASHLRDLSDELGVNVEWLQEMQFVAKQSGANVDDLEKVMRKLAQARAEALSGGGGKQLAAFQKFGVGVQEIQSGKITDIVDKIAKAFETGNQQELIPAFQAIGGKGAAVMIPAFLDGLAQGRAAAVKAGAVISEDAIDQLDEIDDAMARLGLELKAGLAPIILTVVDALDVFRKHIDLLAASLVSGSSDENQKRQDEAIAAEKRKVLATVDAQEAEGKITPERAAHIRAQVGKVFAATNDSILTDALNDLKAEAEARKKAADARKALRHKRENANIEITPLETAKEKFRFAKNSDALSGIGNFLGGSGAGADLVSIGEKTNQLLTEGNRYLGSINSKLGTGSGDGGVPNG